MEINSDLSVNTPAHVQDSSTSSGQCANSTTEGTTESTSSEAFLYIVVVLSFYAVAMVILIVKYIHRENQEAQLSYYFHEFIRRDKFHTPQYENKLKVNAIKRTLNRFYLSMGLGDRKNSTESDDLPNSDVENASRPLRRDSGIGSDRVENKPDHIYEIECQDDSVIDTEDMVSQVSCCDTELTKIHQHPSNEIQI